MYTNNKNQKSNSKLQSFILGVCIFLIGISANAQCAMCRAALGGDSNTKKAEAVNDGIVYLMVIPYLLVLIIGYLIYRMYSKKKKAV
ncbi:hypothetical protein [Flavobacterium anhuiense]|uniref:hypothetical protein n=1 Tax=Flavobacterium anhuiense TaxID=459526 RepID=UPI003D952C18